MSETQLASIYIGEGNGEESAKSSTNAATSDASLIHILDGQSDLILDYITIENLIEDNHKKSLEDTLETFDFIAINREYSEHLEKRNRVIIPDEDGQLREFVLAEVIKYRDTEGYKVQAFATASYLELKKANVIYPHKYKGSAGQHGGRALNDTGWQMGIVEIGGNIELEFERHTSPYEYLRRIVKEFGGELNFRIEHDGHKITGRYVDILERIGSWDGREIVFGEDLDGIQRKEKQDIVTALLGLGPEKEDGTRLEVLVEDEDALQRWGRIDDQGNLNHLIEAYEIQSERTEMTEVEAIRYTRTALDKRINEQVSYEATVIDLEDYAGLENHKIRFGDTLRIKDEHFHPPLYLEARVYEMNRSLKRMAKKDIKLGDYIEYTEEEVNAIWAQLQKEIQDRLARMVIATVISSGGDVFKNGVGSTALTAKTFVAGNEADEDGVTYDYQWIKLDKNGEQVDGFIETGKTITVTANDIDEKATYRVLIAYGLDVVTTSEYTLTHLYDGQDGVEGRPGKDGEDGKDGKSSYTHVRYSQNANGSGMTPNPTNAVYIGIAIAESPTAPTSNTAYDWSKIKGDDGIGTPGEDGKTSYVHIKYSNDGGTTFTGNNGENPGDYIGTYTDFTQADSNNVNDYTWAKVKGDKGEDGPQGIPGEKGEDGKTYYTWVKYANTPTSGMSDNPSGKDYIGFAYNKETPTMSTNYNDYTWSLYKGPQGVQGIKGADGQTTYTWVKYADTDTGGGMSDNPKDKLYIGLAFNKPTATESNNAGDYTWSLMPQNIEIGGRNLLPNTSQELKNYSKTSWDWNQQRLRLDDLNRLGIEVGTELTLKVYIDNPTQNARAFIQFTSNATTYRQHSGNYVNAGESGWSTVTMKIVQADLDDLNYVDFAVRGTSASSGTVGLRMKKLEKGNVATDWSPAPEDVDASIQAVQTTADGKNSIFRQNTQPSTAGRKVGDVWFKTNADNRMHVFNGTSWAQAGFGEQAIVADSITANHIKSLNGLNVNDQFIVDNQGNVEFGGHLQGASGTFGEVTADSDKFFFADSDSGDKSLATSKGNWVVNHSFNFLVPDYSVSGPKNSIGILNGGSANAVSGWTKEGPNEHRMFHDAQPGLFGMVEREAMFGLKSAILKQGTWLSQIVFTKPNTTYTLSAHIKRPNGYAAGGGLYLRVRGYAELGDNDQTFIVNENSNTVKSDGSISRVSITFTTNSNTLYSKIFVAGTNTYWTQIDGVQLVEGEYMAPYQPDDEIAYIGHGLSRMEALYITGEAAALGGLKTDSLSFLENSAISMDKFGNLAASPTASTNSYWNIRDYLGTVIFRAYLGSNRDSGSNGVQVNAGMNFNVTSGRMINKMTYDTTTSAAPNMFVTSTGYFARSSSARKYKLLEEPLDVDPYKILNLYPKTWFDRPQAERFAEELTKEYNGGIPDFDSLASNKVKRIAGLVAEDVESAGLEQFVIYDESGNTEGLQYDRLWTLLIPIVKDLKEDNDRLKDDIASLLKRVEKLENAE